MCTAVFNVMDFHAVNDGSRLCTSAFQSAIEAAGKAGGGKVIVPHGRYLIGTISLCDNLIFEMMPGAELIASTNEEDYPLNQQCVKSFFRNQDGSARNKGLICACLKKNIRIIGGRITANAYAYFDVKNTDGSAHEPVYEAPAWHYYKPKRDRISIVLMENCEDVVIDNLEIADYPSYAGWFLGCNRLTVRNVKTFADRHIINTDGFHFSSCCGVRVSDSFFTCGDDCIAVDSNHFGDSTDVIVNGCVFDTSVHAVRIYTGIDTCHSDKRYMGNVHRVNVSGCTVACAAGVLSLSGCDGHVFDVSISDITAELDAEGTPIMLATQNGTIRNLNISGLNVRGNGCMSIMAQHKGDIRDITLFSSTFTVTPKTKLDGTAEMLARETSWLPDHCHFRPNNFAFIRAENVILKDNVVRWTAPCYSDTWDEDRRKKVSDYIAARRGITLSDLEQAFFPAVECIDCENILTDENILPDFHA